MNIIGIYKITSPSNKIYIGQSIDCKKRKAYYRLGHCKKQHLIYHSIKKYGWDKHEFKIIHICNINELNVLEKHYVDLYNSFNSEQGLNLKDGGGSRGVLSDESKNKIGDKHRGKIVSDQTKRKISESKKGHIVSIETRKKMSLSNKGKHSHVTTDQQKQKQRLSMIGKRPHRLGCKLSEDSKTQISKSLIGNKNSLGYKQSQETKDKRRATWFLNNRAV